MISRDSVIATDNSFVVVDKINRKQVVRGFGQPTTLIAIRDAKSLGIYIETKHYSIIVSPQQKFIIDKESYAHAEELSVGDTVLTSEGFEVIEAVILLDSVHEMSSLYTEQKAFYANSFLLLAD